MAEDLKFGTDWQPDEIDQVVSAYFEMLEHDLSGLRTNKSAIYSELSLQIGRTRKSVELKFQNISAVLAKLEEPWIRGLAPRPHFQKGLSEAIDKHLSSSERPNLLSAIHPRGFADVQSNYAHQHQDISEYSILNFVSAPILATAPKSENLPEHMERLVRKFDPVLRDFHARSIGEAGERLVVEHERAELVRLGSPDLAKKVLWVSKELGDGAGYDVKSYAPDGREKFIEVKTTIGSQTTPFFMTRNEKEFADNADNRYCITRIFDFRRQPRAFELISPLSALVRFEPESYRASFS